MPISSQTNRLLGYPTDARLLIINADDFGISHSVNEAIFGVLKSGIVRSTSLMVPCPWSLQAMHYLADRPGICFGVHLTVISEWLEYRWGPVTPRDRVPTLVDEAGFFYSFERMPEFLALVNLDQLEMEFRAQIEAVLLAGLKPTHLDWHALRIGDREDIFEVILKLAQEYGLALRVASRFWIEKLQNQGYPTIDYDFLDSYLLDPVGKSAQFADLLHELPVGLNEWAVHPGLSNSELIAIDPDGHNIRQTDYDFLISQQAKDMVEAEGINLLDYRSLQEIWKEM